MTGLSFRSIETICGDEYLSSEQSDIRRLMFTYRSYTPIPFLIVMVLFAQPTIASLVSGALIILAGECLRFWGVSIAGSETRTTGSVGGTFLIRSGPFAYVRNPLYLGNMLLYLGVGVMSLALFPWLQVIALLWFYFQYSMIVAEEEGYLDARFGQDYAEYRNHVRRFIPRLAGFKSHIPPPKSMNPREGLSSERRTLQAIGIVTLLIVVLYIIQQQPG